MKNHEWPRRIVGCGVCGDHLRQLGAPRVEVLGIVLIGDSTNGSCMTQQVVGTARPVSKVSWRSECSDCPDFGAVGSGTDSKRSTRAESNNPDRRYFFSLGKEAYCGLDITKPASDREVALAAANTAVMNDQNSAPFAVGDAIRERVEGVAGASRSDRCCWKPMTDNQPWASADWQALR